MSDYLIPRKNILEHYFHTPNEGIFKRQILPPNRSPAQCVCTAADDGFCVFAEKDDSIHIISTNENGDLVYTFEKNDSLQTHILMKGNGKIYPKTIRVSLARDRTNLLYTAQYGASLILIYCILGINAKPLHIATLPPEYPQICISGTRVYFTNSENTLGYMDFADGKPEIFFPVCENAFMPCVTEFDGKEYLVYKHENSIICSGSEVCTDKSAAEPLLCVSSGKLLLLWRSMNFIKYSASQNGGATWSAPMRFVNSGASSHIYTIQNERSFSDYYGTLSGGELHIIGANNIMNTLNRKTNSAHRSDGKVSADFLMLKHEIDSLKSDMRGVKKTLAQICSVIDADKK